ncbi:hypothetical protein BDR07DRAFT_1482110 [Suillus spraguei]|nr:hypothetical protein BDR07DRAFT_1482110 [Suillus spraguei]
MSRSSVTSKRSRRRSKDSSRGGASAQSADLDERPPPQIDTVPPVDKRKNCEPSVVESSSGISNSGTPQPSEPHAQEDTINDLPQGALTTDEKKNVAQEDQPTLSDIMKVVEQMFHVLRTQQLPRIPTRATALVFLAAYKKVAEEHDDEFLEKYNGDMDVMLIFSGLFSAVSSAFIVAMESNLSPDPDDTTHALLAQLVQIGLGNLTAVGSTPATQASTWSPPHSQY